MKSDDDSVPVIGMPVPEFKFEDLLSAVTELFDAADIDKTLFDDFYARFYGVEKEDNK